MLSNQVIERLFSKKKKKHKAGLMAFMECPPKAVGRELQSCIVFQLPDEGMLFGDRKQAVAIGKKYPAVLENFRLPYPAIALEYTFPKRVAGEEGVGGEDFDATVIQLKEEEGAVRARIFFRHTKSKEWDICNYGFEMRPNVAKGDVDVYPTFEVEGAESHYSAAPDTFYNDVKGEISTLVEFLAVLQCSNVETKTKRPTEDTARRRKAQGKQPLLTYKTLTIPGSSGNEDAKGGTHTSPRTHLRRGHIRRLSSGRLVWVNACVVSNTKKLGMVVKDYLVKKP